MVRKGGYSFASWVLALFALVGFFKDVGYGQAIWKEATAEHHVVKDFTTLCVAGTAARMGLNPYVPADFATAAQAAGFDPSVQVVAPDIYPPATLLVVAPLAGLSYEQAYGLGVLVCLLLGLAAAWLVPRLLGRRDNLPAWLLPVFFASQVLLMSNVGAVQANVGLLLLLVLASLASQKSEASAAFLGGLALALAAGVKIFPGFAFPFLWAGSPKRLAFAAGFGAGIAGAVVATFWVLPADYLPAYQTLLATTGGVFEVNFGAMPSTLPGNVSLNGFFASLAAVAAGTSEVAAIKGTFYYPLCKAALAIIALGGAGVLGLGFWGQIRQKSKHPAWRLGQLALLVYMLVSPMVWRGQLWLVSPLVVWWLLAVLDTQHKLLRWGLTLAFALYICGLYHNLGQVVLPLPATLQAYYGVLWRCYPTVFILALLVAEGYAVVRDYLTYNRATNN